MALMIVFFHAVDYTFQSKSGSPPT